MTFFQTRSVPSRFEVADRGRVLPVHFSFSIPWRLLEHGLQADLERPQRFDQPNEQTAGKLANHNENHFCVLRGS